MRGDYPKAHFAKKTCAPNGQHWPWPRGPRASARARAGGPARPAPPRADPGDRCGPVRFFWLLLLRWLGFGFCHGFWFCVFVQQFNTRSLLFFAPALRVFTFRLFQKRVNDISSYCRCSWSVWRRAPGKSRQSLTLTRHIRPQLNEYSESDVTINSERGATRFQGEQISAQFPA